MRKLQLKLYGGLEITVRARTHFNVKEHDKGEEPWNCMSNWMRMTLWHLTPSVSTCRWYPYEQAKQIAKYMHDHIEQFSVTKWP